MRISNVEVFHIKPRWMLVKVSTDEGLVGWGEPTLEGRATIVEEAINVLKKMIIGEDPGNIEHLFNVMYRGGFYRAGAVIYSAISGIEQALWDIKGKQLGVPVWKLLGGKCRDKIRMYAHILPGIDDPSASDIEYWTNKRVNDGFTALKTVMLAPLKHIDTPAMIDTFVQRFAQMREIAGKNIDIAIDFHGRVSPSMAPLFCKALEPYYPMFIEEPVLPENVDSMVRVAQKTTIPIATGERLFTTFGFREVVEKQAAQVLQPDICHCGGILQAFKIAAMGANYYCSVAPHNPLGPVALAACLQLDTCIPNFTAQEHPTMADGSDLGVGILKQPFEIKNGYIDVPTKPGLGIEVDEELVKEKSYDGKWMNPLLYHEDENSLAEW